MAIAKKVVKKKKPAKAVKTSPKKKNEKNGRQQPKKVQPKKKNTAIESETEAGFDDTEYPGDDQLDEYDVDSEAEALEDLDPNFPDKEY